MRFAVARLFFTSLLFLPAGAKALDLILTSSTQERLTRTVRLGNAVDQGKSQIFAAIESPLAEVQKAVLKTSDDSLSVLVRKAGAQTLLLLPEIKGELILTSNGTEQSYLIEGQGTAPSLTLTKSCEAWKLSVESKTLTQMPARLECSQTGEVKSLIFSTLSRESWKGANLFEVDGKGERYKVFAYKDASEKGTIELEWLDQDKPIRVKVSMPKPVLPPTTEKKPPPPTTRVALGLSYLNASIQGSSTTNVNALALPLAASYRPEKSGWQLSGEFRPTVYSSNQNTLSQYEIQVDRWFGNKSREWGLGLGYQGLSFAAKEIQTNFYFDCPDLILSYRSNFTKDKAWWLRLSSGATLAGNRFTRSDLTLGAHAFQVNTLPMIFQFKASTQQATDSNQTYKGTFLQLDLMTEFK